MSKRTKFVLNQTNFRKQVLMGEGTQSVIRDHLGDDAVIDVGWDGVRARGRMYGSMSDEAKNGTLSRRLGGS